MDELIGLLSGLGYWNWWILALAFLVLELLIPGIYFLWLGFAAAIVGAIMIFIDPSWQWQIGLFAVLTIATVFMSRLILNKTSTQDTDEPNLNRRAHKHIGRIAELTTALVDGRGRVKLGQSFWNVTGSDLPAGAKVRITGVQGALLEVEPEEPG